MRALAVLLAIGLLVARDAHASVPDSYGFGSRSAAMAGAVTADAHDFSSGYYNPAGAAEAPGIEVGAGYMFNLQRLRVNGRDNQVDDVSGLVAGVVAPGELASIPFAFTIGVYLPDDGLSYINARRQGVPRWELYDTRAQLLYLEAALAVRPLEWLELGAGIAYLSATRGE
jgi:long-chain fatty acid transport protein